MPIKLKWEPSGSHLLVAAQGKGHSSWHLYRHSEGTEVILENYTEILSNKFMAYDIDSENFVDLTSHVLLSQASFAVMMNTSRSGKVGGAHVHIGVTWVVSEGG